ncbi:MAG: DegQ family serine endoprotease [Nitrospirae bacterium]|nr:DegQ family serine endoprotease [Nitrospirota bacterium]
MNYKEFVKKRCVLFIAIIAAGLINAAVIHWDSISNAEPTGIIKVRQGTDAASVNPSDVAAAEQFSNVFAGVAKKVNPSVVTIFTESNVKVQQPFKGMPFDQFFGDDFFKRFFQDRQPQGNLKQMGLGSGVIIDADGIILTNNHVVDGADNIKVKLLNGEEYEAKVKGRDAQTDLAVITIKSHNLQPIQIGNSDAARVGEWVLAIGSPFNPQLEHTVTAGIVSGKGRRGVGISQYEDFIQTDAAINPGNSGGALVNLRGELIGINTAIASGTGGYMGVGFAIPSKLAQKVMQDIIEKGKVQRGWLGVYIQDVTPEIAKALKLDSAKGVIISNIQENSPAEKAELKIEDVILKMNGKVVDNSMELSTHIAGMSPGSSVTLGILRDNRLMDVSVTLGELSPEAEQQSQRDTGNSKIGLNVSDINHDLAGRYQIPEKEMGVVVVSVDPEGIAAQVGFKEGDLITKFNKKQVHSAIEFNNSIKKVKPGEGMLFQLYRSGGNLFLAFTMPEK